MYESLSKNNCSIFKWNSWVTNNRCEKGEIIGDPRNDEVGKQLKETIRKTQSVPDLFQERKKLLFKEYPYPVPKTERDITIGIPRVLSYWDTMPFWTTFFKSLGYKVQLSDESTREIYESGLSAVTSDTVCFPAKLVHGHLRNLVKKYHVDRILCHRSQQYRQRIWKKQVSLCVRW